MDSFETTLLSRIKKLEDEILHLKSTSDVCGTLDKKNQNLANLQPRGKELIDFQSVEQNIESGILLSKLDKNYTIIYANEGFANILGYTYEEMQVIFGSGYVNIVVTEDWDYLCKDINAQLESKNNFIITYRVIKKNGDIIWIEDRGGITVREGQEDVMQCIITDISAQKQKEEALLISEKRHEIIMNYSGIATFDYDIRTKKMTLHPFDVAEFNFPTIIDNAIETIINSGVISPESVNDYRELYQKVEAGDLLSEAIISGINADGENWIYELSVTNIFDHRGIQLLAVGAKRDITEKFQLQKEKEFANTLASDKQFVFEVNITKDKVISYDTQWAEDVAIENIDVNSYFDFIPTMCKKVVHPEDLDEVMNYLSAESIMNIFRRGERLVSHTYRKKMPNLEYRWFESKINIIKDEISNDINIRCYIEDINEKIEKELLILEEQKIHKKMMSKATLVYTVNISKDILLSGYETWWATFNMEPTTSYTQMMVETNKKEIYPADQMEVGNIFLRENILNAYKNGKDQLSCNFRSKNKSGIFVWSRCTMNLSKEQFTGDIIGYAYTENIDEEKKKELALIYKAEHDSLTDMYNKDSTEKYITNFIANKNACYCLHAFLIIDIDYFKGLNDNFGHAFGDAILSQVAGKIIALFREEDILGRIGGDEFVVFMKNIQDEKFATKKAQEICESLIDVFSQNGKNHEISASIGIAFYNKHGNTYGELYKHSDSALYTSKENGRNQWTIYNSMLQNTKSAIKAIDSRNLATAKTFASNISEYVFRILHEVLDKKNAINSVLELIGKHYNFSRVYIFEETRDGKCFANTFEWCSEGIIPQIDNLQTISHVEFENYMSNFDSEGVFKVTKLDEVSLKMQEALTLQGIKSLLQYTITHDSKSNGFIGFDECGYSRVYEDKEISELQGISHILGLFVVETRILQENKTTKNMALSVLNGLDSYAYVCDPKTYDVLFINKKAKMIVPNAQIGDKCYYAFWNSDMPCEDCPMKFLDRKDTNTLEQYNDNLDLWINATATNINWTNDEKVCLVNNFDITTYKKEKNHNKLQ